MFFNTSIGYHTITLFIALTWDLVNDILQDFKRYSKETGLIKIYADGEPKKQIMPDKSIREIKSYYKIEFIGKDRGVSWTIRFLPHFDSYIIETKINPKILVGITDYITASNETHIVDAANNYNSLIKEISENIPTFFQYILSRVDYCINFDLRELGYDCDVEQIMKLIERGDIPHHYKKFQQYCPVSHRMKNPDGSVYLKSGSVTINCYEKHHQLQQCAPDNLCMDNSKYVIRFEIQCKLPKIRGLRKLIDTNMSYAEQNEQPELYNSRMTCGLLSDKICKYVVLNYFLKVIKNGDYYTLQKAIDIIERQDYCTSKQERLITTLKLVNECRGIYKAKQRLNGRQLYEFDRSLRELALIDINPVTIPREWGIKCMPGLMRAYEMCTGVTESSA